MSDRLDYFFRQKVQEDELDQGFTDMENADRNQAIDWAFFGINASLVVQQVSPTPNLTVDVVGPGVAYDQTGQRVYMPTTQNVDLSVDSSGVSTSVAGGSNEKIVSLFIKFDRALSDPRTDGNSNTVFFERDESFQFIVRQGAEGTAPATPPSLESDAVLLADVRRSFGQTQILNTDITPPGGSYSGISNRRQDAFVSTAGSITIRENTVNDAIGAVLQELNDHVTNVANAHPAAAIDYAGGGTWADGGTNPATDLESQIDKIISDIAATVSPSGVDRVGSEAVAGSPSSLSADTLANNIAALLGFINARARIASNETITGTWGFDETITTSPSGGQTDPAIEDDREASSGFTLQARWRTGTASAIRIRLYTNPLALGSESVLLLTYNLVWSGTGTNFTLDDTGATALGLWVTTGGIFMRSFSGAGTKDFTSAFDAETNLRLFTTSSHLQQLGGVWQNDDQIEVYISSVHEAAAGSDTHGAGTTFPKLFPVAPSTVSGQTNHILLNTSSPVINNVQISGASMLSQSSAAGQANFATTFNYV